MTHNGRARTEMGRGWKNDDCDGSTEVCRCKDAKSRNVGTKTRGQVASITHDFRWRGIPEESRQLKD